MKITIENINKIITDCKGIGYNVRMSDIAYAMLSRSFKDITIPYTILYGKGTSEDDIKKFDKSKNMKFLKKYIESNFETKDDKVTDKDTDGLTFGENKEQLIKNLETIRKMKERGELDAKDFIKLDIEIRTKLIDKFKVEDKQDEQRIIVYAKYDAICPYCHHEVKSKPAEEAIREIKEKYDLVPKKKADDSDNSDNVNIFGDE